MHILGLVAENYKRLRVVEIHPKGRMVQITGKNAQGKTSVLDAIWTALKGASAMPEKPVRKGAEKARIKLNLGEFVVSRTITPNGGHTLTVENAKGVKVTSPQAILDELLGALTFDPLSFVGMKPKQQVEMLRQVAKLEINIDEMNEESERDYRERTIVNRDIARLEVEVASITVQDGLPKEKVDDKAILAKLNAAGEENTKAQEQAKAKQQLAEKVTSARYAVNDNERTIRKFEDTIAEHQKEIARLKKLMASAVETATELNTKLQAAADEYEKAPEPPTVDVSALTQELQQAQIVNREIDKRTRRQELQHQLDTKRREADQLTRAMEGRDEAKRSAIQFAKMPVPGLTFDENQVMFYGIPIDQLGEAEQIRISTAIAMAANPKLRILRVMHGEALDDDSLKILADMAEQNDFQIWMAKVDSSGKVGIVMEDGMVKAEAAGAEE